MNNPRTMNAVYEVAARVGVAARTGWETLEGGERDNTQFQDFPQRGAYQFGFFQRAHFQRGSGLLVLPGQLFVAHNAGGDGGAGAVGGCAAVAWQLCAAAYRCVDCGGAGGFGLFLQYLHDHRRQEV